MAFCPKCGSAVAEGAAFCPACGAAQGTAGGPPSAAPSALPPSAAAQSQMDEKLGGLLCYVLGWITGIIFLIIDKRSFVQFHAKQSIVIFGGLNVLYFVLATFSGLSLFAGGLGGFSLMWLVLGLVDLAGFVLWIFLMIKAYQGERFRVPVAADFAEKIFGKS